MNKSYKVIILPTEKTEAGTIRMREGKIFYNSSYLTQDYLQYISSTSYHLYIISDNKIQEDDWFIYNKTIVQAKMDLYSDNKYKIIATTDKSLKTNELLSSGQPCPLGLSNDTGETYKSLPQIPQSFIKQYVESNGKIDEVLVEFERVKYFDNEEAHCEDGYYNKKVYSHTITQLKLQNNEVTIHQAKTYTREEIEVVIKKAMKWANDLRCEIDRIVVGLSNNNPDPLVKELMDKDKWIKENL